MAERNRDVIEKLRARADTTAKTFGALATTAVTAIGFAKLGDIYPLQDGLVWPLSVALIGFLLMILSVAFFTARLWGVAQPIMTRADPDRMTDLRRNEPELVEAVDEQTATLNGVRALASYELRAHRFARIADSRRTPTPGRSGPALRRSARSRARQPPAQLRSSSGDARAESSRAFGRRSSSWRSRPAS